jgi:hypothetical protein
MTYKVTRSKKTSLLSKRRWPKGGVSYRKLDLRLNKVSGKSGFINADMIAVFFRLKAF